MNKVTVIEKQETKNANALTYEIYKNGVYMETVNFPQYLNGIIKYYQTH